MTTFSVAFQNVLITLLYILPGFLLQKCHKATESHLSTISGILIYICSPCMIMASMFALEYSKELLAEMGLFLLASFCVQALFMLILFLLLRKKYDNPKYRVFTVASTLGNVGFFGLPIVRSIFPEYPVVAAYSCMFAISMNLLIFTMGIFCMTGEKKHVNVKNALLNPYIVTFVLALPLFIFGINTYFPTPLSNGIRILSETTTPLCMIVLGIRLASAPVKNVFTDVTAYVTAGFKLLIFPLFAYLLVYFLPLSEVFKAAILILAGSPCAVNIQNIAEMYNGEKERGANCVFIATLLSFLTIPLLTLIL